MFKKQNFSNWLLSLSKPALIVQDYEGPSDKTHDFKILHQWDSSQKID